MDHSELQGEQKNKNFQMVTQGPQLFTFSIQSVAINWFALSLKKNWVLFSNKSEEFIYYYKILCTLKPLHNHKPKNKKQKDACLFCATFMN